MFGTRFKIFRLLGFPIYLDLSWFAIAVLITWSLAVHIFPAQIDGLASTQYWTMGILGALGLFASIVAHELGHAVVARRFDLPMRGITLFIFGGVAEMTKEPPSAKAEFFVAIAGPIVSVLIAVGGFALVSLGGEAIPPPTAAVIWYLATINTAIVVFNMIPAFPLDGGRVLRSILWQAKGNLRWATKKSSSLGAAFGFLLMALGLMSLLGGNLIGALWQILIGMFLRRAAQMSYQQVLIRRALEGEPVSRFMNRELITIPPSLTLDRLVQDFVYRHHHKMYPVTRDGHLIGCVTTRHIQQVPRDRWQEVTVQEIAQPCDDANTTTPDTDAMDALAKLSQNELSRMLVVSDDRLEGILSLRDLMKFIALKVELEGDEHRGAESHKPKEHWKQVEAGQKDSHSSHQSYAHNP